MTILADLPAGYTPGDIVTIRHTIWTVRRDDYASLTETDRRALSKLAVWPGLDQAAIDLIALVLDERKPLPLDDSAATLLHSLLTVLPAVSDNDLIPTLAPTVELDNAPATRALITLAALTIEHDGQPGGELLRSALLAAIRAAWPHLPINQAPAAAGRLIVQARRRMEDAEQTQPPTLPPFTSDGTRADLTHIPHSITVEPVTPELRRVSELPHSATLVVVERHAGRLAKVCSTTDVDVADYASWGYSVTIEDLARGIAGTYGATFVTTPAA
ncbi:hypothetical protein ACNF49_13930 [Actinomadura sp. ATCC 39365]